MNGILNQVNNTNTEIHDPTQLTHLTQVHAPAKTVKHYDGSIVGQQFIDYFYLNWCNSIQVLVDEELIKSYSKIRYNGETYEGCNFVKLLSMFAENGLSFSNCNCEILDSGSRQVYILVSGIMIVQQIPKQFSQTFMIAYTGENIKKGPRKWTLMNSLLVVN